MHFMEICSLVVVGQMETAELPYHCFYHKLGCFGTDYIMIHTVYVHMYIIPSTFLFFAEGGPSVKSVVLDEELPRVQ